MALNADQLATLKAVVDEESFDGAAFALGISTSAVSQRIRALENHIGTILLHRTTPVEPTKTGAKLVQLARQSALLESEHLADLGLAGPLREVTVAVNADSLATWFRPVLCDAAGWGWGLHLRMEDETHTLAMLRRGEVEAAVTTSGEAVTGCQAIELGALTYIPAASPKLVERFRDGDQLNWSLPMLRFAPRDRMQDRYLDQLGASPTVVSYIPTSEGFVTAVREGLGWALLPISQVGPELSAGRIMDLRPFASDHPSPTLHSTLYWQSWKLTSNTLQIVTESVVAAADEGLDILPAHPRGGNRP